MAVSHPPTGGDGLQHFFAQTNIDPILKFSLITLITVVAILVGTSSKERLWGGC